MNPFIYALVDPADSRHIRYVGMAASRFSRPFEHAKIARKTQKHSYLLHWIRSIQTEGREPSVLILEELSEGVSRKLLGFVESCYIRSLREIGHNLTNGTNGGDGGATFTGRKHSVETRVLMSAAQRGRKKTPEHCANVSAGRTKQYQDPEEREKMSIAALAAYANNPEIKKQLSESAIKMWQNPEFRKGRAENPPQFSEEARAGIAASNRRRKGIPKSPEGRARMLIARRARAEREKLQKSNEGSV